MAYKSIKLKRYNKIVNENDAAESITPGALIELDSNGEYQNHSTADGPASATFALEDELQGNSVKDDYASGDPVQGGTFQPGDEVLALVASSYSPTVGEYLTSAGNGNLQARGGSGDAIAVVINSNKEVDDNNNERVRVRII